MPETGAAVSACNEGEDKASKAQQAALISVRYTRFLLGMIGGTPVSVTPAV
ncbi:hypothetical protein D3C85_1866590 [compost metagenome]